MKNQRTEAIVLRRTNYGEADRIVQLLTPGGKVSALARGSRRQKSKLAGAIELLALSDITLHDGRGKLSVLTSARLKQFFVHILDDYDRLQLAYYVLKDASRVAEHVTDPELFSIARETLASLDRTDIPLIASELWYRLQLSNLLGVGVNLLRDSDGAKLLADSNYRFDSDAMAFCAQENGNFSSDHIKLLRLAQTNPPAIIAQVAGLNELAPTCLDVVRAAHQ